MFGCGDIITTNPIIETAKTTVSEVLKFPHPAAKHCLERGVLIHLMRLTGEGGGYGGH